MELGKQRSNLFQADTKYNKTYLKYCAIHRVSLEGNAHDFTEISTW